MVMKYFKDVFDDRMRYTNFKTRKSTLYNFNKVLYNVLSEI